MSQTAESLGRKKPQIAKAVQEMGGVETIRKGLVVLDGGQPSLPDPPPAVSDTAEHLRSEAALLRGMADRLEAIANAIERQPFEHPDLRELEKYERCAGRPPDRRRPQG